MNDKEQQALAVLDAIETALQSGDTIRGIQYIGGGRFRIDSYSSRNATGRVESQRGSSLLDCLAQYAQGIVARDEPWSEPGALDAESDEDAFDRAVGS